MSLTKYNDIEQLSIELFRGNIPCYILAWNKTFKFTCRTLPLKLPNIHTSSLNLLDIVSAGKTKDVEFVINQFISVCSGINLNYCEELNIRDEVELLHMNSINAHLEKSKNMNYIVCIPMVLSSGEQQFYVSSNYLKENTGLSKIIELCCDILTESMYDDVYEYSDGLAIMGEELLTEWRKYNVSK